MTARKEKWLQKFKDKGNTKYRGKFDYSHIVNYQTVHDKFPIKCNKHDNIFYIRPDGHLRVNGGCPICRHENNRLSLDDYKTRCNLLHSNKYSYELITELSPGGNVKIVCKEHGIFAQNMYKHLFGNGCPECAKQNRGFKRRFYKDRPTMLYYIKIAGLYKIGLTQEGLKCRYRKSDNIEVLATWEFNQGTIAFDIEKECLKATKHLKYLGPTVLERGGDSELRTKDVLGIIKPIIEEPFG